MKRQLIYRSVVRGHGDADLDQAPEYPYFGMVRRVPVGTDVTAALFEELEELTWPRVVHGFMGEPVPGEPYERYEVFDVETEDLLVMYRVPFRPVEEVPEALESSGGLPPSDPCDEINPRSSVSPAQTPRTSSACPAVPEQGHNDRPDLHPGEPLVANAATGHDDAGGAPGVPACLTPLSSATRYVGPEDRETGLGQGQCPEQGG
jgi:hypothetical protein